MDSAFVDQLVEAGGTRRHQAALFALVMASNLGAIFTIIGALAGIM
jgi:Na+/H+ antiporter NhaD/arsenite permease-like protein